MAKFFKETELNLEIEKIFNEAFELIVIVSPFIKLHPRLKDILKDKMDIPELELKILFGKNDGDLTKSINPEDLKFFTTFPNVEILYQPRLHAKYYANEFASIITSMNLYDYSLNNNIEVGIRMETPRFSFGKNGDQDAFDYFSDIIKKSDLYFKKVPQYTEISEKKQKYEQSNIIENKLSEILKGEKSSNVLKVDVNNGFCIRCNAKIDRNTSHPFCNKCFTNWDKFKKKEYPEKYCHICGKPVQTTFSKPSCNDCYKKTEKSS